MTILQSNNDWFNERVHYPTADELAKEINVRYLVDLYDPNDPDRLIRKAGEQLSGFGEMRDDGTTLSGCWIYAGSWTEDGNNMARRDNSDPTGLGQPLNLAWSWPTFRPIFNNLVYSYLLVKHFVTMCHTS